MGIETRIHADAEQRTREAKQAYRDYVAARNGDTLSRGVQRTEPNYMAAFVIIVAAAMFGGLMTWAAHTLFTWLVRAAG